jgi:hypothetical protein
MIVEKKTAANVEKSKKKIKKHTLLRQKCVIAHKKCQVERPLEMSGISDILEVHNPSQEERTHNRGCQKQRT